MDKFVRELRKNSTDAERLLWSHLRSRRLCGCKFRRQEPMGRYIVDFVCVQRRLIVEVDGGQHTECKGYDDARSECLQALGYKVIRVWNHEVLGNLDEVLEYIRGQLLGLEDERVVLIPSPRPSPGGRGGKKNR